MANIPRLRAVLMWLRAVLIRNAECLDTALSQGILAIYHKPQCSEVRTGSREVRRKRAKADLQRCRLI